MVWFIVCERHLKHFHHKMHVNIPKNTGTGYEQTAVNYKHKSFVELTPAEELSI